MQNVGPINKDEKQRVIKLLELKIRKWHEMTRILPHLYLGSLRDANDIEELKQKQIDYIVSIHELSERAGGVLEHLNILHIQMADVPEANISEYFAETTAFIHHARLSKKSVLVHCIAGVSRSVCIVAAYLIAACDMTYAAALAYIASKRPCANPNFGFRMQLVKYAEKRSSLEGIMMGSQFGNEAIDELKANDKKMLLECTIAPLPDVSHTSVVCRDTKSLSPNISVKEDYADSVKYQSDPASESILNYSSIGFIDQ